MLVLSAVWTWKSLLLRPEYLDETATFCIFFTLVECHYPRQRCAEAGAEVGRKRDYHKEKSGGWESGGGKLIFVTSSLNSVFRIHV